MDGVKVWIGKLKTMAILMILALSIAFGLLPMIMIGMRWYFEWLHGVIG